MSGSCCFYFLGTRGFCEGQCGPMLLQRPHGIMPGSGSCWCGRISEGATTWLKPHLCNKPTAFTSLPWFFSTLEWDGGFCYMYSSQEYNPGRHHESMNLQSPTQEDSQAHFKNFLEWTMLIDHLVREGRRPGHWRKASSQGEQAGGEKKKGKEGLKYEASAVRSQFCLGKTCWVWDGAGYSLCPALLPCLHSSSLWPLTSIPFLLSLALAFHG